MVLQVSPIRRIPKILQVPGVSSMYKTLAGSRDRNISWRRFATFQNLDLNHYARPSFSGGANFGSSRFLK